MDAQGRYEGQVIYLYPNLTKVIIGMLFESINGLLAEAFCDLMWPPYKTYIVSNKNIKIYIGIKQKVRHLSS